jgi:hypothetical protein
MALVALHQTRVVVVSSPVSDLYQVETYSKALGFFPLGAPALMRIDKCKVCSTYEEGRSLLYHAEAIHGSHEDCEAVSSISACSRHNFEIRTSSE